MGMVYRVKVICKKGRKNSRYTHNSNREIITVLKCICASEHVLPPLIVTKGSHHYAGNHIRDQGTPGTVYTHSPNGWSTNQIGLLWLENYYKPLTCSK